MPVLITNTQCRSSDYLQFTISLKIPIPLLPDDLKFYETQLVPEDGRDRLFVLKVDSMQCISDQDEIIDSRLLGTDALSAWVIKYSDTRDEVDHLVAFSAHSEHEE